MADYKVFLYIHPEDKVNIWHSVIEQPGPFGGLVFDKSETFLDVIDDAILKVETHQKALNSIQYFQTIKIFGA